LIYTGKTVAHSLPELNKPDPMKDIKKNTENLLDIVDKAFSWANQNNNDVTKSSVKNALKAVRRSLRTIDKSIEKRPSIAIFGQSQVGKSYLVQNLTKPEESKFLMINASESTDDINFLNEMNPDGGRESTGVVTRFTTNQIPNDSTHPFYVELFSQIDIAAILLNSFWSDLKNFEDTTDGFDLEEFKELLHQLTTETLQQGIDEDEAYFFCRYVLNNFNDVISIRELNKLGYFKEIESKILLIKPSDRWHVLHYLWGKNKFITEVFKILSEELEKLKFHKLVRVDFGALTPKSTTILDVERIKELFNSDINSSPVGVKLPDNTTLNSHRSIFSILTKEVQLQIANSFEGDDLRSFINSSDILDFPGSKSREKVPLSVFNNNSAEQKLQLLVRGKVSYLFDTYTNNLGIATLLYCMDDNPPEEKEAPSRLYNWVKKYVGENKEDRSLKLGKTKEILNSINVDAVHVSPLIVVLTKFNQEVNKVIPGAESNIETHDSKWFARVDENFVKFMSRPVEDKWINNWTNDETHFKFIFPVRDPMYSQATFEGYETSESETKIRPERVEAMNAMGLSFSGSEIINKHTISPKDTWSEISKPNGTGVSLLSKQLNLSAHPIVTETRLQIELKKLRKELLTILLPYQISGNIDQDLKLAKKESLKAYTSIVSLANSSDNALSHLLNSMVISDTEIWNLLYDFVFGKEKANEENSTENKVDIIKSFNDLGIDIKPGMSSSKVNDLLRDFYEGLDDDEIKAIVMDHFNFDLNDLHTITKQNSTTGIIAQQTEIIVTYWVEKVINESFNNDVFLKLNEKQKESFRSLLSEILKSREMFELEKEITKTIKSLRDGAVTAQDIDLVASCCSVLLNNFLFSSGWTYAKEENKPLLNNYNYPVFSENGRTYDIEKLNYSNPEIDRVFFKEWSEGCKSLFIENVKYEYGVITTINAEANSLLNEILDNLNNN